MTTAQGVKMVGYERLVKKSISIHSEVATYQFAMMSLIVGTPVHIHTDTHVQ